MSGSILTINAGSSSLKFALFDNDATLTEMVRGETENFGATPHFCARDIAGKVLAEKRWPADVKQSFADALGTLLTFAEGHLERGGLVGVGHRIVHGGAKHSRVAVHVIATDEEAMIARHTQTIHQPHILQESK